MKGLLLSGGKGTRLRPLTYTGAKQLVPLANKPVLFYALEDLVSAGITDIGIVVGDTADQIQEAVGDGGRFGCSVTYIRQDHPGGLAHAVKAARSFLGQAPFVMYLGDNVVQHGIGRYAETFRDSDAAAHLLLCQVAEPGEFGVVEVAGSRIMSIEEKPQHPRSDLALVGIYFFRAPIHDAIESIQPSWRGELEITDAIRHLLQAGHAVRTETLDGWWIDTGKMEDMLEANRLVLQAVQRRVDGSVGDGCLLQGNVVVEAGATLIESVVRGPVVIGAGARIERAYVGPFSAIGANCVVRDSEIEHTILMERGQILDVPHRIEDSIIGRDVVVTRSSRRPRAFRLIVGDYSRVGLL